MDEQQKVASGTRCCDGNIDACDMLTTLTDRQLAHQLQPQSENDLTGIRMMSASGRSGSSSDVLKGMYDTAVDRYDALKREYDKLRQHYEDLLRTMNDENVRNSNKYAAKCQELSEVKEEMTSLRQQCTAAIHKWNSMIIQNAELSDAVTELKQKNEESAKESNRLVSAKDEEIISLHTEKEELANDYKLLMSERDTVLKEIDQLQDKLNDTGKKTQHLELDKRKLQDEVISLHEEIASAMQDRDRALKEANELRQHYGDIVCQKEEAKLEINAFRTHLDMLTQERNAARQERLEAIKNYERILQETYEIKEKAEEKELASKEAEALRRDIDVLRRELADAREEAVVAKMRRDWAFSERDKIVLERESVRRQCDELRRERDRAVSGHADVLRELDGLKKYKLDATKQLKDLRELLDKQERMNRLSSAGGGVAAAQNSSRDSAIDADMQEVDTETLEVEVDGSQLYNLDLDVCGLRGDGAGESPVYISSIAKGHSYDGKLRVNDILLRVNDVDVSRDGTRKEAVLEALRAACAPSSTGVDSNGSVRILVRRRRQQHSGQINHVTLHVSRKDSGMHIEQGLYISKIENNSVAARDGTIAVGDRLLYVNHKSVEHKSLKEVMKMMDSSRDYLTVSVSKCRNYSLESSGSTLGSNITGIIGMASSSGHKLHNSQPSSSTSFLSENGVRSRSAAQPTAAFIRGGSALVSSSERSLQNWHPDGHDDGETGTGVHNMSKKSKRESGTEQKMVAFFDKWFGGRHHKHQEHHNRAGTGNSHDEGSDEDEDTIKLPHSAGQPALLERLEAVLGQSGCNGDGSDTWPKYRQPVMSGVSAAVEGTLPHGTLTVRAPRKERPGIPAEWVGTAGASTPSREVQKGFSELMPQRLPVAVATPMTSAGGGGQPLEAVSKVVLDGTPLYSHSRSSSQVDTVTAGRYSSLPASARANPVSFDKTDKSKSLDSRRQRPESMHFTVAPSMSSDASGSSLSFQSGPSVPALFASTDGSDALSPEFNKNVMILKLKQQVNRPPWQARGRVKREPPPIHATGARTRELHKPAPLNLYPVSHPHAISPITIMEQNKYAENRPPSSPFGRTAPSPTLCHFPPNNGTMGFPSVPSSPVCRSGASPMPNLLFQMMSHHSAPHQVAAPLYTSPPAYKDSMRHSSISELENAHLMRRHVSAHPGTASPSFSHQSSLTLSSRATTPHGGACSSGSGGGCDDDLYHANYRPASASTEPDGFFTYPKRKNQPERINLFSGQQVASKSSINKISNGSIDNISPSERSGTPVVLAADGHRHSSCSLSGNRMTESSRGSSMFRRRQKPNIGDIRTIEVDKSTEPLGFQIEESPGRGVFVSSVSQNSLAAEAGIEVGDQILDVCGINMRGASYEQASHVLRQFSDMTITMLLQFNPDKCLGHELDTSLSSTSSVSTNSPISPVLSVAPPVAHNRTKSSESATVHSVNGVSNGGSCASMLRQSFRGSLHSKEGSGGQDDNYTQPSGEPARYVCVQWMLPISGAAAYGPTSLQPLGVRLVGGNATGVFVNDILPGSPASTGGSGGGLRPGDHILEFNGIDLRAATGERVLLEFQRAASCNGTVNSSGSDMQPQSSPSSGQQQLILLVHNNVAKWSRARERRGIGADLFYVRALFSHDGSGAGEDEGELTFVAGDLLLVESTLHEGRPGRWHAWRVDEADVRQQAGTIPSRLREESFTLKRSISENLQDPDDQQQVQQQGAASSSIRGHHSWNALSRRSFLRRRRHQRGSDSAAGSSTSSNRELMSFSDLSVSSDSVPCIDDCIPPVYQRVEKRESNILRPVIVLGPFSEALVEKLTHESPDKYVRCDVEIMKTVGSAVDKGVADGVFVDYRKRDDLYEVVRVSTLIDIATNNRHCMLLVGPAAVDRLYRLNIYPVVLYIKHKSVKQVREVKDPRFLPERLSSKSAKEMFERFQKVETDFKSQFSAVIPGSSMAAMCQCIKQAIDSEQKKKIWIPAN